MSDEQGLQFHIIAGSSFHERAKQIKSKGYVTLEQVLFGIDLASNERRERTLGGASDDRLTLFFSVPAGFFISLSLLSRRDGVCFLFRFFSFFFYRSKVFFFFVITKYKLVFCNPVEVVEIRPRNRLNYKTD